MGYFPDCIMYFIFFFAFENSIRSCLTSSVTFCLCELLTYYKNMRWTPALHCLFRKFIGLRCVHCSGFCVFVQCLGLGVPSEVS